ncbi:hypothetical protein [Streptomyces sp. NPDC020607]|uniref:hypothetical protein n=1 Tax=Streptomyces sp. NPDC020607 TaxID=3365082 RepID=UPI0037A836B6
MPVTEVRGTTNSTDQHGNTDDGGIGIGAAVARSVEAGEKPAAELPDANSSYLTGEVPLVDGGGHPL